MTGGNFAAARIAPPLKSRGERLSRFRTTGWFTFFAVIPTSVTMLAVFGIPLAFSLYMSFRGWSMDQGPLGGPYVGWDNYTDLMSDDRFVGSMLLSLGYTAATVAAELILGLAVALVLDLNLPLMAFFRTVMIVPMMMTPIVAALCWKLLLDPIHGVINLLLGTHVVWLGEPSTALMTVAGVNVWQNAPYVAVLLLAGLRSLPREPLEAASIDGAGSWQALWYVVLPMIRPYILVALLLRTIFEFRAFENVYVLTGGGPADSTMLISIFTYTISFFSFDLGLGAASSWMMLAVSMLMCAGFIAVIRQRGKS